MTRTNYDLGTEIEELLADFCEASDNTPKVRAIRNAVKFYIEHRRDRETELAKRMEKARKSRLAPRREKITVLQGGTSGRRNDKHDKS